MSLYETILSKNKINYNTQLGIVDKIIQKLISLNCQKSSINDITVSKVKSLIKRMVINRFNRLVKVYWAIDVKNKEYKETGGRKCYSACDIYRIVAKLLKSDYKKVVCPRTIRSDIKMLNEMGLLQSIILKLGKNKAGGGSIAHYVQNMSLVVHHKQHILSHLIKLLEEKLKNKKIIGDFDKAINRVSFKTQNSEQFINNYFQNENSNLPVNINSHHIISSQYNKANISNIHIENSLYNSKIQKKNLNLKKNNLETRLMNRNVQKDFLYRIKELSNNQSTYINALNNLEIALKEHVNYKLEYVLEHFLEQFSNTYKYKIWMMMRRSDGVVSDYNIIWQERFIKFVKKKLHLNDYVKKVLEMETKDLEKRGRERLKRLNGQLQESKSNNSEYNPGNVDKVPEKIIMIDNRSGIARNCLGFKTTKGITLKSLGICKKSI